MPQKISEALPTKQSIYKLADKLKTTASLIDRARQVTNCADSQEMG
jgi:hypothetical protein